jgi:hypothetical protein
LVGSAVVHYGSDAKEAETVVAAPDGAHKLARQVRAVVGDRLDILVPMPGLAGLSSGSCSRVML